MARIEITHKEVAKHVGLLPIFGLCRPASTALEGRPLTTADDSTAITCATVALGCFAAADTQTHYQQY